MSRAPISPSAKTEISSQRVYRGIMRELEEGRLVPGQMLPETGIADRFNVGRNAVREAMQHLSARGVVDLSRHRSPTIRLLDRAETFEILSVARAMTALAARTAAERYVAATDSERLAATFSMLTEADATDEPGTFSRARRHFYRILLGIGGNRELLRLFPAIGMHVIYAQYQTRQLRGIRLADYQEILSAVTRNDPAAAAEAGGRHVDRVRQAIERICDSRIQVRTR